MLYGVNCLNGFKEPRTMVFFADSAASAITQFNNEFNVKTNRWEAVGAPVALNPEVCSVLYQSGREIEDYDILPFTVKGGKVEVENVRFANKKVSFDKLYWHFNQYQNENLLEVMICIHDGRPNWLY